MERNSVLGARYAEMIGITSKTFERIQTIHIGDFFNSLVDQQLR